MRILLPIRPAQEVTRSRKARRQFTGVINHDARIVIAMGMSDDDMGDILRGNRQFDQRGVNFELYRDIARVTGRLCGVEYAEGLDISRMIFI